MRHTLVELCEKIDKLFNNSESEIASGTLLVLSRNDYHSVARNCWQLYGDRCVMSLRGMSIRITDQDIDPFFVYLPTKTVEQP